MTVDKQTKKKKKASSHDEAGYYLIFFLVNSYSSPKVLLFVPLRSSFLLSKVYLQISLSLISLIFWLALFIYLSTSLPCDRPMTAFYGLRFHVSFFSFFFFLFSFFFFLFLIVNTQVLQATTSEAKAASKKLGISLTHASKSTTDLA